jgi:hypothetical protein
VFAATLTAANISGVWTIAFDPATGGHPGSADCTFTQEGTKLNGRCGESGNPASGEVNGQKVMFQIKSGEITATYRADLDRQETSMKGTWRIVDAEKKVRTGNFEARKK